MRKHAKRKLEKICFEVVQLKTASSRKPAIKGLQRDDFFPF